LNVFPEAVMSGSEKRPGIRANLYVLNTDEGGRRSSFYNGYRCTIAQKGVHRSCETSTIGRNSEEKIQLGREYDVEIWMIFTHPLDLEIDETFDLCEGNKVVARGRVTAILEPR
jgi:translation elongation factor EF-Tu-like GTPase